MYNQYIACLNARASNELGASVAADVVHNERPLGADGYRAMLEENVQDIPDLYFNADIVWRTPVMWPHGFVSTARRYNSIFAFQSTNGAAICTNTFFYTLRARRIAGVFSVIDKIAVEARVTR